MKHNVHHVHVPEEKKTCSDCGRRKNLIGVDVTNSIKFVPAHLEVDDYELEKFACGYCKNGVTTAEGPKRVIVKRSADSSLLAHVVVSKYADHTPLTRQSRIFARGGAAIPVSTLSEWVNATADFVEPIVRALEERVKKAHVIGTDATGLKVLEPQSAEKIVKGTMWCYVGDGKDVLFKYAPTGEGETGPWEFLKKRTGYVQADAASVFDRLFNGEVANAVEVGCWAHARRRFVSLQDTDCRVAYPLQLIARLYKIEHLADAKKLSPKDRTLMRKERSLPTLEKLKRSLAATLSTEPPSSELAKATRYILNHWDALTRFAGDGSLLLDNNITEQQMRDIALGRKNYLFAGSHDSARRAAGLYSLMRSCAQHGVAPTNISPTSCIDSQRTSPPLICSRIAGNYSSPTQSRTKLPLKRKSQRKLLAQLIQHGRTGRLPCRRVVTDRHVWLDQRRRRYLIHREFESRESCTHR